MVTELILAGGQLRGPAGREAPAWLLITMMSVIGIGGAAVFIWTFLTDPFRKKK